MHWYSLKFSPAEIKKGQAKTLAVDFKIIYLRTNKLKGMGLFRDKNCLPPDYLYFIRLPDHFPFDPIQLFGHKGIVRTFPPAVLKLELIEGDY